VSLNSYTSCVEYSALCWKQFPLKEELLEVVPLKMERFVSRKRVSEKCENNINQNPSTNGTKPSKISKYKHIIIIIIIIIILIIIILFFCYIYYLVFPCAASVIGLLAVDAAH
jgi:hypothetical protein